MRARLRDSVCLLIAFAPVLAATAARAGELLVMPYACSVMGGDVVLRRSPDEGHRILSRREDRDFTACSPADPSMCRKWTLHRFDVDCGGQSVPWASIVAAADKDRSAWVENGRLQIRMPSWWTAGGGRPGDEIVEMPRGFAPKFGINAIFVADDGRDVAGGGRGAAPQDGGYPSRMAGGLSARGASDLGNAPPGGEYEVQPGSALPPVGAEQPGAMGAPSRSARPGNLPFEMKPPEAGLTVEGASEPGDFEPRRMEQHAERPAEQPFEPRSFEPGSVEPQSFEREPFERESAEPQSAAPRSFEPQPIEPRSAEPRREHTFTSPAPEPEPEMTWAEPPPLPEQLDPSLRREMAGGADSGGPSSAQTGESEIAQAPTVEPLDNPGAPTPPAATDNPPAAGGSNGAGPDTDTPVSADTASSEASASDQQPGVGAGGAANTDAPPPLSDPASTPTNDPPGAVDGDGSQIIADAPNPADPPSEGLLARVLSGEPAAVAVVVIAAGLLAILAMGLSLRRRRQDDLSDFAARDISSVSLDKGSSRPQSSPGAMMHDLGGPSFDSPSPSAAAPGAPIRRAPSLDAGIENASARAPAPAPALASAQARRNPADTWGDAIPRTHAEALRVLGMGVTRDASPASIKKVVDGLRMSWHPDYAEDEADRRLRELRMKQINAAWEIISGARPEQPEEHPARRPEKLHQL